MEKGWKGLPYYPISDFYKQRFGGKVYKIPVSVVDNCPNRMGLKGMQTCVFCDVWGSAANAESLSMELRQQIETYHAHISKKYNAEMFLVYFQAYTNTFTKLNTLRGNFTTALEFPYVKGFVVGTRPDCLSPAVIDLWNEFHQKSFVAVELGVQSFFDEQLIFLRRGHTAQQSLEAIKKITERTSVDLGIHLMFGLPGETREQIIETAHIVNSLPISNVKLHNLHVLKNTPLEEIYHRGEFEPMNREEYTERVRLFLKHLSPRVAIHRLAAFSSRWEELVAPAWTNNKMGTHQFIIDSLRQEHTYQSELFNPQNEVEQQLKQRWQELSLPTSLG